VLLRLCDHRQADRRRGAQLVFHGSFFEGAWVVPLFCHGLLLFCLCFLILCVGSPADRIR